MIYSKHAVALHILIKPRFHFSSEPPPQGNGFFPVWYTYQGYENMPSELYMILICRCHEHLLMSFPPFHALETIPVADQQRGGRRR